MKGVVFEKVAAQALEIARVLGLLHISLAVGVGLPLALFVMIPVTVSASDGTVGGMGVEQAEVMNENMSLRNLIDEVKATGQSLVNTPGNEALKGKFLNLLGQAPFLFSQIEPVSAEGAYRDLVGALAKSINGNVQIIFPSLNEKEDLDEKMTRITAAAVERASTVSIAEGDDPIFLTDAQVKEAVQKTIDVTKGLNDLSSTLSFGLPVNRVLSIDHKGGTAFTFPEKVLQDHLGAGVASKIKTLSLGLSNGIKVKFTLPADIKKAFTLQVEPVNGMNTGALKSVGIAPFRVNMIVDEIMLNSQVFPMTVTVPLSGLSQGVASNFLAGWSWQEEGSTWVSKKGVFDKKTATYTFDTRDLGVFAILSASPQFKDISQVPWAKTAIEDMAAKGVINGVRPGIYLPEQGLTRAQLSRLLVKTLLPEKEPSEGKLPFTDLKAGAWYAKDVAVAYEYGIIKGVSQTFFAPDDLVTREQMISMVTRALRVDHAVWVKDIKKTLASYKDYSQISNWAQESVAIATEQGILSGSGSSSNRVMNPKGTVNRAMGAVITSMCYRWRQ